MLATLEDVSKHFGITTQGLGSYITRHIDKINEDGEHAKKNGSSWIIDEIAVRRIEELRGFGVAGVIENLESEKIKDRDIIIANLQTQLTAALAKSTETALLLADAEKERRQIAEARISEAAELADLRARSEIKDQQIEELKKKLHDLRKIHNEKMDHAGKLAEKYNSMKEANLFERIFKKW